MKISFVVLTYNRTDALLPVLRSLAAQCDERHEVLIADDGSRADQVQMLVARCPVFRCPVRHVWHPDVGFTAAQARNLAASHATGDYLVFLDGDCIPNQDFVRWHTRLAQPGCFVNGSRVLLSPALTARVIVDGLNLLHQTWLFWWNARLQGDSNKLLHLLSWPWNLFRVQQGFKWRGIRSCNFGVWRSDFLAVNGFDEVYNGWGHEDADLVLRLCHLGVHRKDGFLATEVFHLWHLENKRDHESVNKTRVIERIKSNRILAEKGLRELKPETPFKISTMSRSSPIKNTL